MSAISSGAALDVNALVNQLVAAERAPLAQRFDRVEAVARQKISAFGQLSSAFGSLKSSLDTLKLASTFGGRAAKSSDDLVFTATATTVAGVGNFSVSVESLASAQKLISAGLTQDADLGAGQLSITAGTTTFTVDLTSDNSSPTDIRDAINTAAKTAGATISATVVNADDGQRLVLTSTLPGAVNDITVTNTSSPVNAALDALVYDPGTLTNLTEQNPAADALLIVDGVSRSSSSNTFSDFVPGLTFNLKAADPGVSKTLTVTTDNSAAKSAAQSLVSTFNAALKALADATKFNQATNAASVLTGDSAARNATSQLRIALGDALGNAAITASNLGLSTSVTGTLTLDSAKFDAALNSNPTAVQDALSGDDGIAGKLAAVVTAFTGANGVFTNRTQQLNDQLKRVADDRLNADRRLASLESRLRKQFTALDGLLTQAQSTSSFLAQQLAGLSRS